MGRPRGDKSTTLADLLRARKESIIREWERRVLADPSVPEANRLPEPILRDHVPAFIDALAAALEGIELRDPSENMAARIGEEVFAVVHARARLAQAYSFASTLREWVHFRSALMDSLASEIASRWKYVNAMLNAVDAAMVRAAMEVHDADLARRQQLQSERDATLAFLETLFTTVPVGIAFLDRDLRYARINETLANINGVPVNATEGRKVAEVVPELADAIVADARDVLGTGIAKINVSLSGATRGTRGETRYWLASYYPVRSPTDEIFAVGCVVIDVTDRERDAAQLRQVVWLRDRFVAILGHDLRTPIGAMMMGAALIRAQAPPGPLSEVARRIESSGKRAADMIHDLLEVSRAQTGQVMPIAPAPTDLGAVVRQVVDELRLVRPDRRAVVRMSGDCRGLWDPDRLAQAVSNLLKNAFDYSQPGTDVEVDLECFDDVVHLSITNQGDPIAADVQPNVFDPFRRAAQTPSNPGGLGLGLFIVKQIVEGHGGRIALMSDETGTTFSVFLPRRSVSDAGGSDCG
ncbi:MAG: PAS domain-containing protein [Polyangiaceae bacterium]|nr:PAS domain-containing protein [Polyangiaceae bacterium]